MRDLHWSLSPPEVRDTTLNLRHHSQRHLLIFFCSQNNLVYLTLCVDVVCTGWGGAAGAHLLATDQQGLLGEQAGFGVSSVGRYPSYPLYILTTLGITAIKYPLCNIPSPSCQEDWCKVSDYISILPLFHFGKKRNSLNDFRY